MHIERHYPCPDCGALLWVPLTAEAKEDGPVEIVVRINEDEAERAYDRHVAFNPDLHTSAGHPPE